MAVWPSVPWAHKTNQWVSNNYPCFPNGMAFGFDSCNMCAALGVLDLKYTAKPAQLCRGTTLGHLNSRQTARGLGWDAQLGNSFHRCTNECLSFMVSSQGHHIQKIIECTQVLATVIHCLGGKSSSHNCKGYNVHTNTWTLSPERDHMRTNPRTFACSPYRTCAPLSEMCSPYHEGLHRKSTILHTTISSFALTQTPDRSNMISQCQTPTVQECKHGSITSQPPAT